MTAQTPAVTDLDDVGRALFQQDHREKQMGIDRNVVQFLIDNADNGVVAILGALYVLGNILAATLF